MNLNNTPGRNGHTYNLSNRPYGPRVETKIKHDDHAEIHKFTHLGKTPDLLHHRHDKLTTFHL